MPAEARRAVGVAQEAEIAGARAVHRRGRGADLPVDVVGDVEGRAVGEEPGEVHGLPVRQRHAAVGRRHLVGLGQHVVPGADDGDVAPAEIGDRLGRMHLERALGQHHHPVAEGGEVAGVERVGEVLVALGDQLGELAAAEEGRGRGGVLLGIDHGHRPGAAARGASPRGRGAGGAGGDEGVVVGRPERRRQEARGGAGGGGAVQRGVEGGLLDAVGRGLRLRPPGGHQRRPPPGRVPAPDHAGVPGAAVARQRRAPRRPRPGR